MDESIHLPACNEVLSTCDVYHVINSTRLSPFLSIFCSRARRTWDEAIIIYDYTKTNKNKQKKGGGLRMKLGTGVQPRNCKGSKPSISLVLKHKQEMLYSRKLSREKNFQIGEKYNFRAENFHGLLALPCSDDWSSAHKLLRWFSTTNSTPWGKKGLLCMGSAFLGKYASIAAVDLIQQKKLDFCNFYESNITEARFEIINCLPFY